MTNDMKFLMVVVVAVWGGIFLLGRMASGEMAKVPVVERPAVSCAFLRGCVELSK